MEMQASKRSLKIRQNYTPMPAKSDRKVLAQQTALTKVLVPHVQ